MAQWRPMQAREQRHRRRAEQERQQQARIQPCHDKPKRRRRRKWRRAVGGLLLRTFAPWILRALAMTWRVQREGDAGRAVVDGDGAWIMVAWHGRVLMLLPLRYLARRGIAALASPSRDGMLAALLLQRFGYRVVHGSVNRDGARSIREMSEVLKSGCPIAITPDGPRGPRHSMTTSAAWLARASGAPIISLSASVDRAWRLRSWDRCTIPKPFARIVIRYGDPLTVAADSDDFALEQIAAASRDQLLADERKGFAVLGTPDDLTAT